MELSGALDFYLALLSVQMAILGFVIAGIVALMQIINAAKPRRETRLLIPHGLLVLYITYLTGVLLLLGLAAWSLAFGWQPGVDVFASKRVSIVLLLTSLLSLFWFVYLTYRSRQLLEAEQYLEAYIKSVSPTTVRNYLFRIYSSCPVPYEPDQDETDPGRQAAQVKLAAERGQAIAAWESRYARYQNLPDPFQPIREYLKDSAFKYYDAGTARGLYFFGRLYDKTFKAIERNPSADEYYFLSRYAAENSLEFFAIFNKTLSEKRRIGTIRFAAARGQQFIANTYAEGLLTIIAVLRDIAQTTTDDKEVMLCLEQIQQLTDSYLAKHKKDDWKVVGGTFEQICLAVTSIAEHYYVRPENTLQRLPVSAQSAGEYRTVTGMFVEFFTRYQQLADTYKDAYPVLYFEAIEAMLEALLESYADIMQQGHGSRGMNRHYQTLLQNLYNIYLEVGQDAIEHDQPELLALCMSNIRRIIKPAKELNLIYERTQLTNALVLLAIEGVGKLGDVVIKSNQRTISAYAQQTLQKHATVDLVEAAIKAATEQPGVDLRLKAVKPLIVELRSIKFMD